MAKRKPFSVLKWLVFPSLSLALAACIAWFNLRAFGWEDGAIYLLVVAAITTFSIAINKYVKLADDDDPTNDHLALTAFVFEIVLTVALIVNAAYSLSVQREMSIARQQEARQGQDLESVSKLKSRAAQREAAKMLREQSSGSRNSQAIFSKNEGPLFWIMVGELAAYAIAAFTLLAVSSLQGRRQGAPQNSPNLAQNTPLSDFPEELDIDYRPSPKKPTLRQSDAKIATPATVATVAKGEKRALKVLRGHLREIAFYTPEHWFRADLIDGGVSIRLYRRDESGRELTVARTRQSDKILAAVDRPDFPERLRAELTACGFPIGGGER